MPRALRLNTTKMVDKVLGCGVLLVIDASDCDGTIAIELLSTAAVLGMSFMVAITSFIIRMPVGTIRCK